MAYEFIDETQKKSRYEFIDEPAKQNKTIAQDVGQGIGNLVAGAVRGAGSIGATPACNK